MAILMIELSHPMKKLRKIGWLIVLSLAFSEPVPAQEVILSLLGNPRLDSELQKNRNILQTEKSARATNDGFIWLPFYDDFTQSSVFPDPARWSDRNVFVNSDFDHHPFNRGVATFDALDSAGNIYSQATFAPFLADKLTSRPIRLDSLIFPQKRALTVADSLYLSFYYQPQGLGNDPQPGDSLVLQFLDTIPLPYWRSVWSSPGMKLDTFYARYGTYCRRVNIPITDSAAFFRGDFQFRFVAYASLTGDMLPSWQSSMDHWNVDAVSLTTGGHYNDSTRRWIGFAAKAPSMLKHFYSVPYTQYSDEPTAFITDTLTMFITNRDSANQPARYGYQVLRGDGTVVSSYDGGNYFIEPFLSTGYFANKLWARPPVRAILPIDPFGVQDSASFFIRHILQGDEAGLGDTVMVEQRLTNFFAYDDGVPELGYGLTPAGAQMAVRFKLTRADTVRAVRLYFNKVVNNANQQYFNLVIWKDNNGIPGDVLYVHELIRPEFANNQYGYTEVLLNEGVPVLNSFFAGIVQTTDDNLNIGFDRSRDNRVNNFYNVDGTWQQSQFPGALMVRPVLGRSLLPAQYPQPEAQAGLELWPTVWQKSGSIRLIINGKALTTSLVEVFDLSGHQVLSEMAEGSFTPESCGEGVYIVKVTLPASGVTHTQKLIIVR